MTNTMPRIVALILASFTSAASPMTKRQESLSKNGMSKRNVSESMAQNNMIGYLARENGLPVPDDWQVGWILTWTGKRSGDRSADAKEISANRPSVFAGHLELITDAEFISFAPAEVTQEKCDLTAKAVMSRDYNWLENQDVNAHLSCGEEQQQSVFDALEAGIQIETFPTLYSPRRLQEIRSSAHLGPHTYSWNVRPEQRVLNCNTFFQAWHITKDLPWTINMRDHHARTSKRFGHLDLTFSHPLVFKNHSKEVQEMIAGRIAASKL